MARQQSDDSALPPSPGWWDHSGSAWLASLLITFVSMAVIEIISREIRVMPSPGPILLLAVVYSAFTGGTVAGLVSSLLIVIYFAAFLTSQKNGLNDPDGIVRLTTLATTAPIMAVLVGMLRRDARRGAFIQAVRRSEERYRSLVSASSQVVWTTNAVGDVVDFLPTWCSFTGQTFEQMKGRGWSEAVHPDDLPHVGAVWEQSLRNRAAHEVDFRVRRADGQWRDVHGRAVPVLNSNGTVREWIGTLNDVTEQRQAERALQQQKQAMFEVEERSRIAVASAGIGTWDRDLITGELDWSDRCKASFGFPADSPVDYETFLNRIHPDDRDRAHGAVEKSLDPKGDGVYENEYRVRWPDGTVRWIIAKGKAFFREHEGHRSAFRFIGTALDITDRKQAELNIRRAKEEAEAANRAKDQFLAALSHELRTPLTPVLLMATTLENDASIPQGTRNEIGIIRRNVELESRLIDDLLDLTRISRGKLQLHLRPIDPVACLNAALEVCHDEVLSKGLTLTRTGVAGERLVQADSARMQQVFWNLVKNAVKFTPAGGEIRIESQPHDALWSVSVIDSGIGIEPEILPRIFDAFEQGEDHSRQFGGLGMGLAISKALVEMHGGKLLVHSDGKDRGARFTVELPAIATPHVLHTPEAPPAQSEMRASKPLRILLVEDHDATSHVLSLLLRRLNHEVTAAPTLADARQFADGARFDLLISDLGLPDGSGLDLMRELRAKFNLTGICLSGYGMDRDIIESREAGFARHLTKPVDFRSLKATIESVTA